MRLVAPFFLPTKGEPRVTRSLPLRLSALPGIGSWAARRARSLAMACVTEPKGADSARGPRPCGPIERGRKWEREQRLQVGIRMLNDRAVSVTGTDRCGAISDVRLASQAFRRRRVLPIHRSARGANRPRRRRRTVSRRRMVSRQHLVQPLRTANQPAATASRQVHTARRRATRPTAQRPPRIRRARWVAGRWGCPLPDSC